MSYPQKKHDSAIYLTDFAPKSLEYIQKRSGVAAKSQREGKKTKKVSMNNKKGDNESPYLHVKGCDIPTMIFPTIFDLLEPYATKRAHLSAAVCHILQMKGEDYNSSITYSSQ
eukprot:8050278-Ditylum_brightwellii.AAC.1